MASAKHNNAPAGFNRRALLKSLPAALVAGAVPAVAVAGEETPVMRLFREWEAADEAMSGKDDDAWELAWQVRWAVEQRLMATPCQTSRDWVIKMMAWTRYGDGASPDRTEAPQLWAEARALVAA